MKPCIAAICWVILAGANSASSAEPLKVAGRQTCQLEGWRLFIRNELFKKEKDQTARRWSTAPLS
jgi:hypothetical protein